MSSPHQLTLGAKHKEKPCLMLHTLSLRLAMLFSWLKRKISGSNHPTSGHVRQDVTCLNNFAHLQIHNPLLIIPLHCDACDQSLLTAPPAPQADPGCGLHHPNWPDLPAELVASIIAPTLDVASYLRMAAACKSWHASLLPPLALQKKPYLMLFSERQPEVNYLLDLDVSNNNNIMHRMPPLPEIRGQYCVCSQRGYLALIDEASNPTLFNPLTGSCIHLPKITTLPELTPLYDPHDPSSLLEYKAHLPVGKFTCPLDRFRLIGIRKMVTSHDFTSALAIFGNYKMLICLKPGDDKWTMIDTRPFVDYIVSVTDIICHRGRFLVAFADGSVFSLDVTGPSIQHTRIADTVDLLLHRMDRFLVEMPSGQILQVGVDHPFFCHNRKRDFKVWRLDVSSSSWIRLGYLGDYSLFLGSCYTFPFLTTGDNVRGFRPNCLYFTDTFHRLCTSHVQDSKKYDPPRDIGIYSMEDASITAIHLPHQDFAWPLPVWIVPSGS